MDSEVKYTDRFLKLNRDSSVEESKMAYDEMAPSWEKVYKCSDKWISVLWFYPSPNSTLTFASRFGQNVGLGEG